MHSPTKLANDLDGIEPVDSHSCFARVYEPSSETGNGAQVAGGPSHMILFVVLPSHIASFDSSSSLTDPKKGSTALYMVDTGFGGPNIMRPLLLHDGHVETGRGGEEHRLVRARHPDSNFEDVSDSEGFDTVIGIDFGAWEAAQWLWILQVRQLEYSNGPNGGWRDVYTISPVEFFQRDFNVSVDIPLFTFIAYIRLIISQILNYTTSHNPSSVFLRNIYVVQIFLTPPDDVKEVSWRSELQHPDLYPVNPKRLGQHIIFGNRYSIRFGTTSERKDIVPQIENEDERIRIIAGIIPGLLGRKLWTQGDGIRTLNGNERLLEPWADGEEPGWAAVAKKAISGRQPELK